MIGVELKSCALPCEEETVKLQIWDTTGQGQFRNARGADPRLRSRE
jgi:hypothetical protein